MKVVTSTVDSIHVSDLDPTKHIVFGLTKDNNILHFRKTHDRLGYYGAYYLDLRSESYHKRFTGQVGGELSKIVEALLRDVLGLQVFAFDSEYDAHQWICRQICK